ncbi:MAG: hypothetical protein IJN43_16095 [Ruminococcus sp.]|nr:hypothetical protein [Oscillospiraceae bacterium]MBQ6945820.1 hypothetical protein [Ruminococcus sp.]
METKYGYKEIRRVSMMALRSLCIKMNWFVKATNKEYAVFLNYATNETVTTDDLVEMATQVKEYSDTHFEIEDIMYLIAECCHTYFEETEEE